MLLANLAFQAWVFHSKYHEVSLKASCISHKSLPFLPSTNMMWAICEQMIVHLWGFSWGDIGRVTGGSHTIPDLPKFRAQKPSPWPAYLDEDMDIHYFVSPQTLTGYGCRNTSICPSNTFFIPTSHTPTQRSWYAALTAELFQNIPHGNKSTSLLRLLWERPVLTTVKRSLLSDFQHRAESKIKIAWSQLSYHWLCIPFEGQGCLLRLKMANTLRRINSSSSGTDLWVVLFSNRDPSQPFTAHSDAASKCSLSPKASVAACASLCSVQIPGTY